MRECFLGFVCRVVARKIHLFFTYTPLFCYFTLHAIAGHSSHERRGAEGEMHRQTRETRQGRSYCIILSYILYVGYISQAALTFLGSHSDSSLSHSPSLSLVAVGMGRPCRSVEAAGPSTHGAWSNLSFCFQQYQVVSLC